MQTRWKATVWYADGTTLEFGFNEWAEFDRVLEAGPDWTGSTMRIVHYSAAPTDDS